MTPFIKKETFNFIKKCLIDLNNSFLNCLDAKIVETTKFCTQDKILSCFTNLSADEKEILNIDKIIEPSHISTYLKNLEQYVYGMNEVTPLDITKIFKKEKKIKLPNINIKELKPVYLGWIDESTKKLFITYNMNGKLLGMACRLPNTNSKSTNICTLCNHIGSDNEVAFVSPICKPKNQDDYKSLGFHICLNSNECNERITSTEKLENLLKIVNRLE